MTVRDNRGYSKVFIFLVFPILLLLQGALCDFDNAANSEVC